ncbi:conserved hypothetical protein [Gloeothece citriformis PCC 7424]|uniref:DUF4149 domain-containing protein n=1 Tax=Gloeothece citriformis (strain PCC 7424) TaxID=65393 RepID=B7KGF9_GLOC7|nr:hypothetical protein [Gloeothece citriformis]ACK70630.1 conserved hypothetical protein [Gloeothece citriformis PCC 7424]
MNTYSERGLKQINWPILVMFVLGFWLSATIVLDLVIMPSLLASGMMATQGFASAGYLIFGIFNRLELLCAAIVLSGFLVFRRHHTLTHFHESLSVFLAGFLLVITLIYTYILTPYMSGLGLQLNWFDSFNTMNPAMIPMHWSYWILEGCKLLFGFILLKWCYKDYYLVLNEEKQ